MLKMHIRFGDADLEVVTKVKGEEAPYRAVDLEAFVRGEEIPEFDGALKWRWQEDRPPRRRVGSGEEERRSERNEAEKPEGRNERGRGQGRNRGGKEKESLIRVNSNTGAPPP